MSAGAKRGTPMSTVTSPSSCSTGSISPPAVSTRIARRVVRPAVADELDEAARAVAALLDLAAVGVVDPVAEVGVGARRPLDDEHLVAADAEVAVGERAQLRARQRRPCCAMPSNTTKSLPSPCILVNFSLAITRSAVPLRGTAATPGPGSAQTLNRKCIDVAVVHHVLLALEPHLARLLRAVLALAGDEVGVRDHLGADEALLEVGVDDAGRLRRRVARREWSTRAPPSARR